MIAIGEKLTQRMGELLGPRSVVEIVITLYEDDRINYQLEGMRGPVSPGVAYKLLECVAREVAQAIEPDVQQITIPKETPQS